MSIALERTSACSVLGCGRAIRALGYCEAHYRRFRKTGSPGSVEIGRQRRICAVDGCDRLRHGQGYCDPHYQRLKLYGDLYPDTPIGAMREVHQTYSAVHQRVPAERGPAVKHLCRHCSATADEWAYDHTDPNELIDPDRGPFSTETSRYMPLCFSCHRRLDIAQSRVRTGGDR